MTILNHTDETGRDLRLYLLGGLDDDATQAMEVEMLADDDAYAAMLAAEVDLIDAYARGELADDERTAFERLVLPRRGLDERVAFARHLAAETERRAGEGSIERSRSEAGETAADQAANQGWGERFGRWLSGLLSPAPAWRLAPIAAALVLAVASGWLAVNGARMADRVATLEATNADLAAERSAIAERSEALAAELTAARDAAATAGDDSALAAAERRVEELEGELVALRRLPRTPPRRVASNFVLSLATRSAGVRELLVPTAADDVRLQLDTAGDAEYYDAFQVRVLADGAEAWSATGLAADATTGTVDVTLAAELMPPGRYEVLLEGSEDGGAPELVGAYEFEVRRP
ncbi:MAG TPA: hypothetical protein VKU40_14110 [Thermoanaerobaculia bacterium]|nr:hypothetical protein [Thermoanaerobaculia bacterium]